MRSRLKPTSSIPPGSRRGAAEQITASRPHLHDERLTSAVLTRFRGTSQQIAAWVLTPPGYDPAARNTYPTVYTAGGYGTTQQARRAIAVEDLAPDGDGRDPAHDLGIARLRHADRTTEFADSVNNGPWSQALVREVIPALEAKYRMDAKPSGRFLTGHSSGGWFALWTVVRYPQLFGGAWATSPDPADFRDFLGVDLYAPDANMYHDANGALRPEERDHGTVRSTIGQGRQARDRARS